MNEKHVELLAEADIERAIAIVEDSRQTHVNWANWRRQGHGTDEDHEMVGDLAYHEEAIAGYDHVLRVLRAASEPFCRLLDGVREEERVAIEVEITSRNDPWDLDVTAMAVLRALAKRRSDAPDWSACCGNYLPSGECCAAVNGAPPSSTAL